MLNGFRADYPWQGSRSSQFQQVADVVAPPVAALILGAVWGVPDAVGRIDAYLADLHAPAELTLV